MDRYGDLCRPGGDVVNPDTRVRAAEALRIMVESPIPLNALRAVDALTRHFIASTAPPISPPIPPAPTSHAGHPATPAEEMTPDIAPPTSTSLPTSLPKILPTSTPPTIVLAQVRAVVDTDAPTPEEWYRIILQIRDLVGVTR